MKNHWSTRPFGAAWLVVGLSLLGLRSAQAEELSNYHVQVLAQLAQPIGDFTPRNFFALGQLNDNGQLVFVTGQPNERQALVQISEGKISRIAQGGEPGPDGKLWPTDLSFVLPISMNDAGNVAFMPLTSSGTLGAYRWNARNQTNTPMAVKGMPAVNNLVFESGGSYGGATINNRDEVAFVGFVKTVSNTKRGGVFVRRPDGQLLGVAVPGDPLPGEAREVREAADPSINDAGVVAFDAIGVQSPSSNRAYIWEKGTTRVIAEVGTEISGFGQIARAISDSIDRQNKVVVVAWPQGGLPGLFLWSDGEFTQLARPGQEMPGGGQFNIERFYWGYANQAGHFPFAANVEENGIIRSAAYQVDPTGTVSLIVKSGMTTNLGTISQVGGTDLGGISINSKGQVALVAKINKGRDSVLLLTPRTP